MAPVIRFKHIEFDSKKLTITQFRQLELVPLCGNDGKKDESLTPVGTVRYKQEGIGLWLLAMKGDTVVKCPLNPKQTKEHLEEQLSFWTRHAAAPHNQRQGEKSVAHGEAEKYKLQIAAEPARFEAHAEASTLEQIFL